MILQALDQYYHRLADDPKAEIPLPGFGAQKIYFALVLDPEGNLVPPKVLDLRETAGRRMVPRTLVVPERVKRTSQPAANFMWDNTGYALGADDNADAVKKFDLFKKRQEEVGREVDDQGMKAVLRFLDSWSPENASELPDWEEMAGKNVVFVLDGEQRFIHEREKVRRAWLTYCRNREPGRTGTCLVSGERTPISRLHPPIKGVAGAQTSGAAIVSFNKDAFLSYNKTQNYNAPVGEDAAFAYATGLNHLLSFNSRQRIRIGDTTTVFWTERDSPVEGFMGFVFDPGDDGADTADVRRFLEAVRDGNMPEEIKDPDMRFYILGLSPNASRLSVRFWHVSTVKDMLDRVGRHFRDLALLPQYDSDPEFPPMWRLLKETAVQRDSRNISPLLSGGFTRSMLTGAPYPQTLLTAVITRIRADRKISYLRSAMIKAFLVRKHRDNPEFMEVKMALDEKSTNTAYRLGRLFAVLERTQGEAVKAGASIKDKFFSSASATPAKVFPHLVGLNQHHIKKIRQDKKGYAKWLDKKIEEITNGIEPFEEDREGFPAHLSADEQGLFILGYYQQRKDLFTKKTDDQDTED